jgi:hypothetical protein
LKGLQWDFSRYTLFYMDMDNHPIPQDVSHFQFKLIGEMTVKQFGYLGGGMVMAWLFMVLPILIYVKLPIAAFYAGAGIILAFVPIEGRPADIMVKNFAKALFLPNQYLFKKESGDETLSLLLKTPVVPPQTPQPPTTQQQVAPSSPTVQLPQAPAITPQPQEPPPSAYIQTPQPLSAPPMPTPQDEKKDIPDQINEEEKTVQEKTLALNQALEEERSAAKNQEDTAAFAQAHKKVVELEEALQGAAAQKEQLEKELLSLKQKLATTPSQPVYTPSIATPPAETPHVRKIPKTMGASVGLPSTPDVPNVITGIVKDSRGNVLPNILIEVKDAEGNPVRAFKTNQLGQFASATPLLNGTYTIFFEDPGGKHSFDTIEITTSGDIFMPIEIISIDQREELRKELFG